MRLIDADALYNVFITKDSEDTSWFCGRLEDAPTIDLINHGYWVFDHMTGERSYYACCSCCRKILRFFKDKSEEFNYCPDCGAKMDLED